MKYDKKEDKKWNDFIYSMDDKISKQVMSEGIYLATDSGEGLGYWCSLMLNDLVEQINKGNLVLTEYNKADLFEKIALSYDDSDREYSLNEQTKQFLEQINDEYEERYGKMNLVMFPSRNETSN
tara:strand:- start:316 stop:687 length:372 start_codon:yes stop_codon:yes gene_type:complete